MEEVRHGLARLRLASAVSLASTDMPTMGSRKHKINGLMEGSGMLDADNAGDLPFRCPMDRGITEAMVSFAAL
ncbi:hypothetical protein KSP39_PZI003339 [Platanthera zijinensis]|uniref:Uncharacterized protein n=1 Tax=Platanthera zijinensis TaxID=2320716 RepID=A0AAP0GDI0_9ASPA